MLPIDRIDGFSIGGGTIGRFRSVRDDRNDRNDGSGWSGDVPSSGVGCLGGGKGRERVGHGWTCGGVVEVCIGSDDDDEGGVVSVGRGWRGAGSCG